MKAKGFGWAALIWALLIGMMLLAGTGACSRGAVAAGETVNIKARKIACSDCAMRTRTIGKPLAETCRRCKGNSYLLMIGNKQLPPVPTPAFRAKRLATEIARWKKHIKRQKERIKQLEKTLAEKELELARLRGEAPAPSPAPSKKKKRVKPIMIITPVKKAKAKDGAK